MERVLSLQKLRHNLNEASLDSTASARCSALSYFNCAGGGPITTIPPV